MSLSEPNPACGPAPGRLARRAASSWKRLARSCAWAAAVGLTWAGAFAVTPLQEIRVSADTTVALGTLVLGDDGVAAYGPGGTVTPVGVGAIPGQADLDAYELEFNGDQLLSFDTTVTLPGGITAGPADVVRYDGSTYAIVFNAAAHGIPAGANVDAVTTRAGSLILSFDVSVDLNGVKVDDDDLVLFDGSGFSLYFDGSAAGVPPGLALDGAHYLECNDRLLLSFDGSGTIGGVGFDDEDVLETDRVSTWEMAFDGSTRDPAWSAADVDAVDATVDLGTGTPIVFGQTITASPDKISFRWPNPVAYKAVRGTFASPASIGSYAASATWLGSGTSLVDPDVPAAGTGSWYLVRSLVCAPTSWQSFPGAEPGRDASLP